MMCAVTFREEKYQLEQMIQAGTGGCVYICKSIIGHSLHHLPGRLKITATNPGSSLNGLFFSLKIQHLFGSILSCSVTLNQNEDHYLCLTSPLKAKHPLFHHRDTSDFGPISY